MPFIDTHCHMDTYAEKSGEAFESWWANVSPRPEAIVHVACEIENFEYAQNLSNRYKEVYAAYGIHPEVADSYCETVEEKLKAALAHPKAVALGEIGLDYHYEGATHKKQMEVFARQLDLGIALKKPIVLHLREADDDALQVLSQAKIDKVKIHVHSFSANPDFAEKLLSLPSRTFIGFTGIVTFKNAQNVRDSASIVPLDRLLLETDAPYLAPVPFRGKPSHAGMIPKIAETLAQVKGVPVDALMLAARQNTKICYGI